MDTKRNSEKSDATERIEADFFGTIQGVGFRPFLFVLAEKLGLKGTIQNRGDRVRVILEGHARNLEDFLHLARAHQPEHAFIEHIEARWMPASGLNELLIAESTAGEALEVSIPVDLATCTDCLNEFFDPNDRRYLYPFIACTNCGPRYSVVTGMPYDRERTTLARFPLCPECMAEYKNPTNRRYHAESTACPVCGPRLSLTNEKGITETTDARDVATKLAKAIAEGKILALRGLGGFQLAVDAANRDAISRLRERKRRPRQPLAVMARSIDVAKKVCSLSACEEEILKSSAAPIIIADVHARALLPLDLLSDGADTLGVMLPTTPLHHLLFLAPDSPDFLVMTSGNRHDEPLCMTNAEARERLKDIADLFLLHDREIQRRCDDSIYIRQDESVALVRGGRGVAPLRLNKIISVASPVLALGADLKNTIGLAWNDRVAISPHLGNLHHIEAYRRFIEEAKDFPVFFAVEPRVIAIDLHPDYVSSNYGRELAAKSGARLIEIQHHHAHAAACMAEHGLKEALALTLDGTGYGDDGTLWGGELFHAKLDGYRRLARLKPAPLPGGEKAIAEPWRQACARLMNIPSLNGDRLDDHLLKRLGVERSRYRLVEEIALKGFNSPLTSAAGRLFDSVAAVLGLSPLEITYEGEAAIRLELTARQALGRLSPSELYRVTLNARNGLIEADTDAMLHEICDELSASRPVTEIALKFHFTLARLAIDWIERAAVVTGVRDVVLSGGVFQNRILRERLCTDLRERSYHVHVHTRVPTGDGGISLGQLAIAAKRMELHA
jgi:hydrogenase maturation protein HypF